MQANELGQALLACDAPLGHDPRQMIGRILERDRLRVRFLARATVILWLLAAGGVFLLVWYFLNYLEPKLWAHAREQDTEGMKRLVGHWVMIGNAAAWFIGTLAVIMLTAALTTVWLVFASRRATLRQVNAQLAEISDQLRQIQQAPAKPMGATTASN